MRIPFVDALTKHATQQHNQTNPIQGGGVQPGRLVPALFNSSSPDFSSFSHAHGSTPSAHQRVSPPRIIHEFSNERIRGRKKRFLKKIKRSHSRLGHAKSIFDLYGGRIVDFWFLFPSRATEHRVIDLSLSKKSNTHHTPQPPHQHVSPSYTAPEGKLEAKS